MTEPRELASGEPVHFHSTKTWYGEKISNGIWVALAHGTEEVTQRRYVAEPDWTGSDRRGYTAEVTFPGPVPAFDGHIIATGPERAPDDHLRNGYVVGPDWHDIKLTLEWNRH